MRDGGPVPNKTLTLQPRTPPGGPSPVVQGVQSSCPGGPVQSSPVQSSPVQSSPVRSSPVQSSPVQLSRGRGWWHPHAWVVMGWVWVWGVFCPSPWFRRGYEVTAAEPQSPQSLRASAWQLSCHADEREATDATDRLTASSPPAPAWQTWHCGGGEKPQVPGVRGHERHGSSIMELSCTSIREREREREKEKKASPLVAVIHVANSRAGIGREVRGGHLRQAQQVARCR